MDPSAPITDQQLWENLRRDVVHVATGVSERTQSLAEASNALADLGHVMGVADDPDFGIFIDIASEMDDAAEEPDVQRRIETRFADAAKQAAERLIRRYGQSPPAF